VVWIPHNIKSPFMESVTMAHRNRNFGGRGGISDSQRRKKSWRSLPQGLGSEPNGFFLQTASAALPDNHTTVLFFSTTNNPDIAESTILRIRGFLEVQKTSSLVGGTDAYAFGICVASEHSAAVVDGVPNPASAEGADWDGWMFLRSSTEVAVDIQGTIVDVKAMRKIKSGDALCLVAGFSTNNSSGGPVGTFVGSLRGLFLLP